MSKLRKVVGSVASLVFVGGLIALALNFQLLRDQLRVWQYQPSSAIITLTDRASLSDRGKHYFYLAHPKLEGANEFNQECQRAEPKGPAIGLSLALGAHRHGSTHMCGAGQNSARSVHRTDHPAAAAIRAISRAWRASFKGL